MRPVFWKSVALWGGKITRPLWGGKRYDSPLINGYTFGYAIGLPYPYDLNISLYSKMLACIYSKFALLEPSRTVKKMAGFVRKITGDNVEGVCTHQGFQTHTGTPSLTFLSSLFIDFRGLHRNWQLPFGHVMLYVWDPCTFTSGIILGMGGKGSSWIYDPLWISITVAYN